MELKVEKRKIGHIIFKQTFTEQLEVKHIKEEYSQYLLNFNYDFRFHRQTLNSDQLSIQSQFVYEFMFLPLLDHIQSMEFEVVQFFNILRLKISKIAATSFENLREIIFLRCEVCSIEALAFLDMESLQNIDLRDNKICNPKTLSKTKWNFFRTLNINNNPITIFELSRIKTVETFRTSSLPSKEQTTMFENLASMIKTQAQIIRSFSLDQRMQKINAKKIQVLKRKHETTKDF